MNRLTFFLLSALLGAAVVAVVQRVGGPDGAGDAVSSGQTEESARSSGDPGDGASAGTETDLVEVVPPEAAGDRHPPARVALPGAAAGGTLLTGPSSEGRHASERGGASGGADFGPAIEPASAAAGGEEALVRAAPASGDRDATPPTPLVIETDTLRKRDPTEDLHLQLIGADAGLLNEKAREGRALVAAGERERGVELYQAIFAVTRDRGDVYVGAIVRDLLELTPHGKERIDYLRYLAEYEPDRSQAQQWQLAAGSALAASRGDGHAIEAWKYLSRACLGAPDAASRQRVLSVLEPFIEKHVLSRGYSPLLTRYTVKQGDSLAGIAKRYGTTIDAIKRINGLEADVIQPRQGLLVLGGEVEVFVDKSDFRLWALVDGKVLLHKPIGLGRNDSTPLGDFRIVERQRDPIWYPQGRAPIPADDPENILGTRWLGFQDTDEFTGFGVHGTQDLSTIGKEASSGCVRMANADVELLFDFTPYGTSVRILD
jgi:hypothetical protein